MNLILDIGNTRIKIGLIQKEDIIFTKTLNRLTNDDLVNLFTDYKINKAIISAVSEVDSTILDFIQSHTKKLMELNSDSPLPIEIIYKTKLTLGNDRIAAAVGANNIFPSSNVLIIDAGTAITYDFINNENQYLGGNISPGLRMRFHALHEFTHKLPLLEPLDNEMLTGNSTEQAIISGVQKGMIFEIDNYINEYQKKYPGCKIIMTGGDAIFFDKKLKNSIFVNLNLVTVGLNRILEYNAE